MLLMLSGIFVCNNLTWSNQRHQAKLRLEYIKILNSYYALPLRDEKEEEKEKDQEEVRQFRRVRRDKKTGVPSKYLTGARNRSAKAKEIKDTAEKYKRGEYIDIKAINKSRSAQDETKKKATKRKNKRNTKKKGR